MGVKIMIFYNFYDPHTRPHGLPLMMAGINFSTGGNLILQHATYVRSIVMRAKVLKVLT